jgi:hypothetical protein
MQFGEYLGPKDECVVVFGEEVESIGELNREILTTKRASS